MAKPREYPQDEFRITIRTDNSEQLTLLLQSHAIDFGCRPLILQQEDGTFTLNAYATKQQIEQLRGQLRIEVRDNVSAYSREIQKQIGTGNHFGGGRIALPA